MIFDMTVYFNDGEIDNYKVGFDGHDLALLTLPDINVLVFESEGKTISLPLRNVKKIEHKEQERADDEGEGDYF